MEEERDELNIYMLELVDLMLDDGQVVRSDRFWKMEVTERGVQG